MSIGDAVEQLAASCPAGEHRRTFVFLPDGIHDCELNRSDNSLTLRVQGPKITFDESVAVLESNAVMSSTQARVALLIAAGCSNSKIATKLHMSPHTARRHTEAVFMRLATRSRRNIPASLLERLSQLGVLDT